MVDEWYRSELNQLQWRGLLRRMKMMTSAMGRKVQAGEEEKLVFSSNNYLSLANHPHIISAVKEGLDRWGFGSGGSRLVCGNTEVHERLQRRLAQMLGKEACLIFPSGYAANSAVLSTLAQRGDMIAADKLVHASIIDGSRASQGSLRAWPHKQTAKLRRLLGRGRFRRAFIVTDSLFSMDGDKAPLKELVELKRHYEATLIVDEAHAFGCLGPKGMGWAEETGVLDEVDIVVGTFSKALGGAGAFVAGSRDVIDYLINRAREFIFTTGIPAVNCMAAEAALDIIEAEPQRRGRLFRNTEYLHRFCRELDLNVGNSESYIVPIMIGSVEKTRSAAQDLWERGFLALAVQPPTVPPGSSRLRISVMSEHTREDIYRLCSAMKEIL